VHPVVKATGLAAIRLRRPDVGRARDFFEDFGLRTVTSAKDRASLRGRFDASPSVLVERGPTAYMGFDLLVDSSAELEHLSSHTGARIVHCAIRGCAMVSLRDPDGVSVDVRVRAGTEARGQLEAAAPANRPGHAARINVARRDESGPVEIYRLGHTVFEVRHLLRSIQWYRELFGFVVSDCQLLPDDPVPVVAFLRFDRGDAPTDHHSLALASGLGHGHMHTAFEVLDMDAVARSQHWMSSKGRKHSWGIGRHRLGSQIFDYWRDPSGAQFEVYADGDVFDASVPTGYHEFVGTAQHQWGPPMSVDMRGGGSVLRAARNIVTGLTGDHDLTATRLVNLIRASAQ
jgi:catechol 2,3-dioxygenase-like lactoylglutathione lyase family enzyme